MHLDFDTVDRWERLCWYIERDCKGRHATSLTVTYRDLYANNPVVDYLRERFLLPVYYRKKGIVPEGFYVHRDWERRVTLMYQFDEKLYQRHIAETLDRYAKVHLSKNIEHTLRCHLCNRVEVFPGDAIRDGASLLRRTAWWHMPTCEYVRLLALAGVSHDSEHMAWLAERAADPATESVVLDAIAAVRTRMYVAGERATDFDSSLQESVTGNPNTPMYTLKELAPRHPAPFFANPVLPLLLLEHPEWPRQFHYARLDVLVKHPDCLPVFRAAYERMSMAAKAWQTADESEATHDGQ